MLTLKRLFFALVVSLGLASGVYANPITLDLVIAESNDSMTNGFDVNASNFVQTNLDLSMFSLPYNAGHNDTSAEYLKQKSTRVSRVAEPSSLMLLGLGLVGLGFLRRRKH